MATRTSTPTAAPPAPPTSTATPPLPQLFLSVEPPSVVRGHVAELRVIASRPVTLAVRLGDWPLFSTSVATADFWSPLGIHALMDAGLVDVHLHAFDGLGREVRASTQLEIAAGDYPAEDVALPPEQSALLDPDLIQAEQKKLQVLWAQVTPRQLWRGLWTRPGGGNTTSAFGTRRSYNGRQTTGFHAGQDFRASAGAPVAASARGIVVLAEPLTVRGNSVWINHGLGVFSGYFHLSEILVQTGQVVKQGDLIGRVGSTGLSTGPHIHWEVRVHGIAVDPLEWTQRAIGTRGGRGDRPQEPR